MTHASVFSGIGGPEVAATMLGWQNLFHCEINPFGRAVLDYWYPESKSYEDITKTDFTEWRGRVNVLTGGFPCQPFSYAGQRRGAEDDRYLWPYMYRCIDQIQPDWVVAENVAGILTMVEQGEVSPMASAPTLFDENDGVQRYQLRETFTLQRICDDLESHGYDVQPILIPACGVGAPHRRDRVFIIGHRIASDTDKRSDLRESRKPTGEDGCSRMEERNEVRQSDIADNVRSKSKENVATDSACRGEGTSRKGCGSESGRGDENQQPSEWREPTEWSDRFYALLRYSTDSDNEGLERNGGQELQGHQGRKKAVEYFTRSCGNGIAGLGRWDSFPSVSAIHRGNDGIPFPVDDLTISFGKWRTEALKAYGNAIVPQVMYEIFRAIEKVQQQTLF